MGYITFGYILLIAGIVLELVIGSGTGIIITGAIFIGIGSIRNKMADCMRDYWSTIRKDI